MATVLVTGASRGLGLEFVRQYANSGWDVIACARQPDKAPELESLRRRWSGSVNVELLDVTHEAQLERLAGRYATTDIDVLINNAGDIGPRGAARELLHKQYFGSLDYPAWHRIFDINVFAPMRVAELFIENVERSEQKKLVFMSSTVGSNVESAQHAFLYATSKAALNKCVSLAAVTLRPRSVIVAAVCPGFARTEMGGPAANVEVADSIAGLRKVIAGLTLEKSGSFTRYNGEAVAW